MSRGSLDGVGIGGIPEVAHRKLLVVDPASEASAMAW